MDLLSTQQQTLGPSFSSSRVLRFSDLSQDEQESFVRFFAEQKVSFFKDLDGSYVANVRLYDPSVIDMSATNSSTTAGKGKDGKVRGYRLQKGTKRRRIQRSSFNFLVIVLVSQGSNKGGNKRDGASGSSALSDSLGGAGGLGLEYGVYQKFTSLLAPRETIKPKARPLSWLMRLIEEIYDQRYLKDTSELSEVAEAGGDVGEAGATPFPQFVVDFFSKRYGLRSLIDQTCWDLLYNLHAARKEHLEAETFARFLEGSSYNRDDLLFFLYVRSVLQKELGVNFRSRWAELGRAGAEGGVANSGAPAPLYLPVRECAIVSRVVFGSESDPLYRTFMALLDRHLIGKKPSSVAGSSSSNASSAGSVTTAFGARNDTRKIEVSQFLHLALVEYHETRPTDDNEMASLTATTAAKTAAAAAAAGAISAGSSRHASPIKGGGGGYDDLAAAGLVSAPSATSSSSSMSRSPNSNAGINSSSNDRLLREAEATYASRLPAPSAASAAAPPPPPSQPSAATASTAGALFRNNPAFFNDLGEALEQAKERYLDRTMTTQQGASSLPEEVQAQIWSEVKQQMEKKLDSILAETIKATHSGNSTGDARKDSLVRHFSRCMTAAAGEAPMTQESTIESFCEAIIALPEVQETAGPLISLLVTYASSRLQEASAGQS